MLIDERLLDGRWSKDDDAALPIEAAKLDTPEGGTDVDDKDGNLGAPKGGIDETNAGEESAARRSAHGQGEGFSEGQLCTPH